MRKSLRAIIVLLVLVLSSAVPKAATAPSAAPALTQLTSTMTGIYRLAYLNSGNGQKETLALVNQGHVIEVHTRTVQQKAYLNRQVQARPANTVTLAGATFNQLISISGGVNNNVNNASATTKQNFLKTAGLASGSTGGSTPMTVPPVNGKCPEAYEPHMSIKDGKKYFECRLKTDLPPGLLERMFAHWSYISSVSEAYAYYEWKWTMSAFVGILHWGFRHDDNWGGAGVSGWEFNGFGFQVLYLDMPGP